MSLKRGLRRMWCLALVAVASPVLAFVDPPYWQTVAPLPPEIDQPLYCTEVMIKAAEARASDGVRAFEMRMAAADLLGPHGYELMDEAGWNVEDRALRYTAGIVPEVEAHWKAGTLRYQEADCLGLARSFVPLEAPAEVNLLISCSEFLYVRSEELAVAGDESAAAGAASTIMAAMALSRLQAAGVTFDEAFDIVHRNRLLHLLALGEGPAAVDEEQCHALAAAEDDADSVAN